MWEVEKKEGGGLVVANYTVRGFEKMGGYLCKTQHLADERDSKIHLGAWGRSGVAREGVEAGDTSDFSDSPLDFS